MGEIYLKISAEDNILIFEGCGTEDIPPFYFPQKWEEKEGGIKRFGTVVVGIEHISITEEAKELFRRLVNNAKHTGDDLSCLDIHTCYGRNPDGSFKEVADEVCISYLGEINARWNIDELIKDDDFFIGCGEGAPRLNLLNKLSFRE